MKAAIFDVDRTIVDGMSGYFFYLIAKPHIPFARRLKTTLELLEYRFGFTDEKRIVEIGALIYAGLGVDLLKKIGEKCFEEMIKGRVFVEALGRIKEHKDAGQKIFLASGSNEFVIAPIARFVDADGFFATGAKIENGASTKKLRFPLCFEDGKLELIAAKFSELNIDWKDCWFYSDNRSDILIFEKCGHPIVVNPRDELEKMARERQWRVELWRTLSDSSLSATGSHFPVR